VSVIQAMLVRGDPDVSGAVEKTLDADPVYHHFREQLLAAILERGRHRRLPRASAAHQQ
jgi:hypothetical protein